MPRRREAGGCSADENNRDKRTQDEPDGAAQEDLPPTVAVSSALWHKTQNSLHAVQLESVRSVILVMPR